MFPPRTDVTPERSREQARELRDVRHVVRGPARQELGEGDRTELGMLAGEPQVRRRQVQVRELLEVRAPQLSEFPDERLRRPPTIAEQPAFAIERREAPSPRQDFFDP